VTAAVTLLVITYNESAHIARCLDSVPFAAEKVVIDSGSEDDTAAIAAAHGARVVQQPWLGFGPQRNFATTQASHDWILFLDADESLSPELAAEFVARLPELTTTKGLAGAILRRRASFMGAPMRWYRPMAAERIERFYHRGRARWTDATVHEALHFDGPAAELAAPLRHELNPTLVHQQLKMLRYSELKATEWLERGRAVRLWECPLVFVTTFFKDYVLRLAMLDGARGWVVAQLAAQYAVYKRLRYFEMRRNPDARGTGRELLRRHRLLR
jgi:glycosyltransferase involved in cell wall biosynthesis